MSNTEFQSQIPEVRRAIADAASLDIPDYTNYGTSAALDGHLAQLEQESSRGAYPGLEVTRQPVGPPSETFTKTVFNFDEPGITAAVVVRPHRDELIGLRVAECLANIACHNRGLFVRRGVGRLVMLDITSDDSDNHWHFGDHHTFGGYMADSNRGEDHDWRYPNASNTYTETTPNSEAGCQMLDEDHPEVLSAEHNADIGSYWARIENPPPGLAQAQSELMREVNHGLPPSPADGPEAEELAKGVYRLPTWAEMVPLMFGKDHVEEQLLAYGDNLIHYAGREYGTVGAVYEQALFTYEALLDNKPAQSYGVALDNSLRKGLAVVNFVEEVLNRKQLQESHPAYSPYARIRSVVVQWQQGLSPELEALHAGKIKGASAMITGAEVADLLVKKHATPTKLLGSLNQLTEFDDFRPFKDEVTHRINQEAEDITEKLGLTAVRPSSLVRAKTAAFFLLCESAQVS